MVTIWVDIFGIYIFGWEGVAQINVVSPQVSGTSRLDHYGRIGPLWLTPNSELKCLSLYFLGGIFTSDYHPQSYWLCLVN